MGRHQFFCLSNKKKEREFQNKAVLCCGRAGGMWSADYGFAA